MPLSMSAPHSSEEPTRAVSLRPHLAYLAAVLAVLALLIHYGWDATWSGYGIHPLQPVFADLRTIQAGLEAVRLGLDPQVSNPADPWGRPMNYPSVWLGLARIMHWEVQRNYMIFALVSVGAFLACCHDLIRRWPSWWTVALALSQAPALLVERANNDGVIFVLLYFSAVTVRPLFAGLLPLAALLKLYPVLALPAFAARPRPLLVAAAGCAFALVLLLPELPLIRASTPVSPTMSFGLPVFAQALATAGLPVAGVAVAALLIALAAAAGPALVRAAGPFPCDPTALRLCLAGAGVFLGSTLLGANWDYRLCFLLMTAPAIAALPSRVLSTVVFALMLAAFNQPLLEAQWGVAGLRANLLAKAALFVTLVPVAWCAAARQGSLLRFRRQG